MGVADLLIVNKTDLVSPDQLEHVRDMVTRSTDVREIPYISEITKISWITRTAETAQIWHVNDHSPL